MGLRLKALTVALTALVAASGFAQSIQNGSFEQNNLGTSAYLYNPYFGNSLSAPPWNFAGMSGIITSGAVLWEGALAEQGDYYAFIQSYYSLIPGSINQTVDGLMIGQRYSVSFYAQPRPVDAPNPISLSAGATGILNVLDTNSGVWTPYSAQFTASSTSEIITFQGYATGSDNTTFIDNVSIQAVPEPATLAVLSAGVALIRRRRKLSEVGKNRVNLHV